MNDSLFFNEIPKTWEEYLPLGNGRLGCMVKTHPCNEVIQLNEEGIWSGGPQNRINPDSKLNLNKIKQNVKDGNVLAAQNLAFETLSGMGFNDRVYQTAGDFKIDFYSENNSGLESGWPVQHKADKKCLETYSSFLDLSNSSLVVKYSDSNGVNFERTVWVSAIDDVIFMHVRADKKGAINFRGYFDRGIWTDRIFPEDGFIFLEDSHGIPFCNGAGCVCKNGENFVSGFTLAGNSCDEVLFFIDIQSWNWNKKVTNQKKYRKSIKKNKCFIDCKQKLNKIRNFIECHGVDVSFEDYLGWHIVEYQNYWKRFELSIGKEKTDTKKQSSVGQLMKTVDNTNVELFNLYANFSRYLLISGSRFPGKLPLTLQGLWNCYMDPPWGSKYTININAQMNYWPVNMCDLSECEIPFFNLLERAFKNGQIAAKKMYGARGFVLHHNTDFWGDSAPQDTWIPGTYWVLGAAWMCTHIFEHYEYTQDISFLNKYYYLMHNACLFFVDFLEESDIKAFDGNPYLIINPSLSPENSYITVKKECGALSQGCEMDNMILEHLFKSCLKSYDLLNEKKLLNKKQFNKKDIDDFRYVLNHIKGPELNKDGSLMEWNREVEEIEKGHRHISHLYGLYPGHTISVEKTPELIEACKKTLKNRLENGGGHTGWSQAWILNFRTQMEQGDEALEGLVNLLKKSTLPNLLDNHPPFQIDGNFGSLSAIVRMFVQSEIDDNGMVIVKLLPALPKQKEWQSGYIKGVKIKGDYTLDIYWEDGKVINKTLIPGNNCLSKDKIKFI